MIIAIIDLFSHKIHSSDDEWQDKLVELAFLFSEFDGRIYNRNAIERRLMQISPRAAFAPRDPSKFRDEISAYPAYLGLFRLEPSVRGWTVRLTDTAKQFLVREEPNVGAFMRIQLALFQYPNGMGAAYSRYNTRIQANARDRTLDFIRNGVHLSPLRLIVASIIADTRLRSRDLFDGFIRYREIFALANSQMVNTQCNPDPDIMERALELVRQGDIVGPEHFESRFHILRHTELFDMEREGIKFRAYANQQDKDDLQRKIVALSQISEQYTGFDTCRSGDDLSAAIKTSGWGKYFDGIRTLHGETIDILSQDIIDQGIITIPSQTTLPVIMPTIYPLSMREITTPVPAIYARTRELADPEATRIKRQRRNLAHKMLVDKIDEIVRRCGAVPKDNPHIDLFAEIPDDGAFLFEVKSGGENLLDQIRKGISQLYEYRFRYKDVVNQDVTLCLVLPKEPTEIPWLFEYLFNDRGIVICWFDNSGALDYPDICARTFGVLNA